MCLDILKLENCRKKGNKMVAQCPACAEIGQDKQGNHLTFYGDGRFGCVRYQGADGKEHRRRIFQLIGTSQQIKTVIDVKNPSQPSQMTRRVLIKNIMGRLGHPF